MSWSYVIKEGLAGIRRTKFSSFASTSAIAVALILIGLFFLVSYHGSQLTDYMRQRIGEIEVFLVDDITDELGRVVRDQISVLDGVQEATYVSKTEAMLIFQEEFGEDATDFYDSPFLPASVKVKVLPRYANSDSVLAVKATIEALPRVNDAQYEARLLRSIERSEFLVRSFGFWLGSLVVLAAIFLVANTVRLTIYARRLLIRTMKLVGATDAFIRRPFVVEGVTQGFVAGIVAVVVVSSIYSVIVNNVTLLDHMDNNALLIIFSLILIGVLLGFGGSYFAVRRFLKNVALH